MCSSFCCQNSVILNCMNRSEQQQNKVTINKYYHLNVYTNKKKITCVIHFVNCHSNWLNEPILYFFTERWVIFFSSYDDSLNFKWIYNSGANVIGISHEITLPKKKLSFNHSLKFHFTNRFSHKSDSLPNDILTLTIYWLHAFFSFFKCKFWLFFFVCLLMDFFLTKAKNF